MTGLIQGQDVGADHRGGGQLRELNFWVSRKRMELGSWTQKEKRLELGEK